MNRIDPILNNITQLFNSIIMIIDSGRDNVLCFPVSKNDWDAPKLFNPAIINEQCTGKNLKDLLIRLYYNNDIVNIISDIIKNNANTDWFDKLKNITGEDLAKYLYPKILSVVYYNNNFEKESGKLYINCYLNYPNNIKQEFITNDKYYPSNIKLNSDSPYPSGGTPTPSLDDYYNPYNYSCSNHDSSYRYNQQIALIVTGLVVTNLTPPPTSFFSIGNRFSTYDMNKFRQLSLPGVL